MIYKMNMSMLVNYYCALPCVTVLCVM